MCFCKAGLGHTEKWLHLYLEVKREEAKVILLLASGVVWHVLHHHLHCVYVSVHLQHKLSCFETFSTTCCFARADASVSG